jgi:DNA polymerase
MEKDQIIQAVKTYLQTAELFGEDEALISLMSFQRILSRPPIRELESSSERFQPLEALYKKFENCQNCSLSKTRNKIVFGMGSLHPKVLFIGEGPGFDEDQTGLPFVGKAGVLLDKIMASIGLDRKTVYIANIVKCHPLKDSSRPDLRGNDRPPLPIEIQSCRSILDQQIEILNPPVICALGNTAARVLLNREEGISMLRGKMYDFQFPVSKKTVPLIPTYHPAALLRNELLKKDVWEDMKRLRNILEVRSKRQEAR